MVDAGTGQPIAGAGIKSLDVQLFHVEEGHADFNTILTLTSQ